MAKRKFVPRLQNLMHKVVIPRYDKKHRVYFEGTFEEGTPTLYLSKYSKEIKAGIPSRITHIKDCGDHAYLTIEPARFQYPSEIQTMKILVSTCIAYNNNYNGNINPLVSPIGNVFEISHVADEHYQNKFIIGTAFGTLWKIPYSDYKDHIPEEQDIIKYIKSKVNMVTIKQYLKEWYMWNPTKNATIEEIREYCVKHHLEEKYDVSHIQLEYDPVTKSNYGILHGKPGVDDLCLACENPCIMPPYRNNQICESAIKCTVEQGIYPREIALFE